MGERTYQKNQKTSRLSPGFQFGTLANPFQYTGREFDAETGMYYNRARYFDSSAGRFLSEDPVGFWGGVNLYRYARNSPVVLRDAFGYQGCNAEQWAQSPNSCAGPQDPTAPYQGPDGNWYNVPEWHANPTPPVPDDAPTPPPGPVNPGPPSPTCDCNQNSIEYYVVNSEVQSEYDWECVKIIAEMVGITVGAQGIEEQVPKKLANSLPVLDLVLWGYHISELIEIQRKANEEVGRRLHCKN